MAFDIFVEHDEKRCGYWIQGDGFDFFAYFTGDEKNEFIECDSVRREGSDYALHLSIRLGPNGKVDKDILESAIQRELSKYWL